MTSWELSPLYRHSHTLVLAHSPHLVSLHRDRLVLRSLSTLSPIRSWTLPSLPHPLTSFAASPNEPEYILVYSAKQRTAWVVDPAKDGEVARIEVGNEGCVAMAWAQTGEGANPTAMAWAAHHLHLSLFPLPSSSRTPSPTLQPFRILSPKHSPSPSSSSSGYSFRPDGRFLAVLERHQARDVIGVYSTGSSSGGGGGEWALVKSITLPDPTSDLADLSWSPCGRYIAAWSSITDYTVHVFTPTGTLLATYTPYSSLSPPPASSTSTSSSRPSARSKPPPPPQPSTTPTTSAKPRTRLDRSTNPYVGLGIRSVSWGRDGEWLAVGGWDGNVRVLSRHGWEAVAEVAVPVRLSGGVNVWREPPNWVSNTRGHGILSYDPVPLPHSLTPLPLDLSRPNPRMGVERIVWSESGRWAAILNAAFPNTIAVFDFSSLLALASSSSSSSAADEEETPRRPSLHTILLLSPSTTTTSSPSSPSLAWQPSRAFSDGESEVLCWVSGEKGFGMWRAPGGKGGKGEKGVAECVGIPARGDFSAHSLAFSADGEALLLSSSLSGASSSTGSNGASGAEGIFCVAYPVYEGDEVHVPGGGGTADDSLGAGGRTWTEDEQEEGETYL
ncbi:hypothetical protein NBRC10513_006126 [Rhodotorula toruloides]|uniref:BY PROTMAP: gi/647400449/emb/CDR45917.1/ RHTO0S11e06326g1_1 [Rhodosporidium toruloides] n=1 Tax=Rhodotorula toruloides TaxID=5286 RepID=A0A0K3CRS2_RHOTO|nr:hypothetical protein AAT19DRAFT_11444 [Rhodotorula toruloides]